MDVIKIAQTVIKRLGLKSKISYQIAEDKQGAAGYYEPENDTVHINENYCESPVNALFTLLHELRHAQQYTFPRRFSPLIRKNLRYVLMYDGTAYKREGNKWLKCKLKGEPDYLLELYLLSPAEIDANEFACNWLARYAAEKGLEIHKELEKIFSFWRPPFKLINEKNYEKAYLDVFDFIENNAK